MALRRIAAAVVVSVVLAGCASTQAPATLPAPPLLDDTGFGPPSERIDLERVFALDDAMRRYVQTGLIEQARRAGGVQATLAAALYRRGGGLKLEYDAARTRDAAEAFDARAGNCLSLVVMTAAFAKALDIPVTYQSAYLEETWSRSGDLLLASGHVNVTLGLRLDEIGRMHGGNSITIDFLPNDEVERLKTRSIAEQTVVAMFANNRAAEALSRGRLDDAYAWASAAIGRDRTFMPAYNTLGVVYLRHGDTERAERVFAHVLAVERANTRAMANLAETYVREGRLDEAASLRAKLASIEPYPPFHFFNLGIAAARKNDWRAARGLFEREADRAGYSDEVHFWLGVADYQLGDVEAAKKEIALAIENSTTTGQHQLYAAKLAWLQSKQQPR